MKNLKEYITEGLSNTEKYLVFDMDGTISDLYRDDDWLSHILAHNTKPYETAQPIYDYKLLNNLVMKCKDSGWRIIIVTYGSKDNNQKFLRETEKVKLEWLKKYKFPYDDFYCTSWDIPKWTHLPQNPKLAILIDDDKEIRREWSSRGDNFLVVDASRRDFLSILKRL